MSITEEIIKALQAVVTPELKALQERVDANHREVLLRFDASNRELAAFQTALAERLTQSEERIIDGVSDDASSRGKGR
jgi:hypothetical protein